MPEMAAILENGGHLKIQVVNVIFPLNITLHYITK